MSNKKQFKILVFTLIGITILIITSGIAGFFFIMRGDEITTVPDVTGYQLEKALISIQERGLNSKIQLRYSSEPGDRGKILSQSPYPGSILRAGKHVTLSVSRGTIIDKIENYVGWNLKDLYSHLKSISATYGTNLKIKEPIVYQYSSSPEGTILQQKPLPGDPLSADTELELIISKGSGESIYSVPNYVNLPFQDALQKLTSLNVPFTFVTKSVSQKEKMGKILSQIPEAGSKVSENTMTQLTMAIPEAEENMVFGILEETIVDYPIKILLKFEVISTFGERSVIFTTMHKGGAISIPYFVENGSTLILSADSRELVKFTIKE